MLTEDEFAAQKAKLLG
ncbi:MAG: hypothetical protein KA249_10730 [Dermatophilaceae bacterium]|nr:hypothetical protein [Dermatophilaceae bacterium]